MGGNGNNVLSRSPMVIWARNVLVAGGSGSAGRPATSLLCGDSAKLWAAASVVGSGTHAVPSKSVRTATCQ